MDPNAGQIEEPRITGGNGRNREKRHSSNSDPTLSSAMERESKSKSKSKSMISRKFPIQPLLPDSLIL